MANGLDRKLSRTPLQSECCAIDVSGFIDGLETVALESVSIYHQSPIKQVLSKIAW